MMNDIEYAEYWLKEWVQARNEYIELCIVPQEEIAKRDTWVNN